MKGLLRKDLYGLKSYGRTVWLFLVAYTGISLATGSTGLVTSLAVVLCSMLPMNSIAVDEQAKWGAYAQCLPVSRRQVVASKYLMVTIISLLSALFVLAISLLSQLNEAGPVQESLSSVAFSFLLALVVNALTLPPIFHFGVEKARLIVMLAYLVFVMPVFLLSSPSGFLARLLEIAKVALAPLTAALLVGSYFLSVKVYEAREL